MQRFRAPRAYFAILPSPFPATRLVWLVGCALLLFAATASAGTAYPTASAGQVDLVWDAVKSEEVYCNLCQGSAGQVNLVWDAVSAPTLRGYRLYYGQASHTYASSVDVGLRTTATITSLTAGRTYYFAVAAYDSMGKESPFSNEVSTTSTRSATASVANVSASPTSGQAPVAVTGPGGSTTATKTGSITVAPALLEVGELSVNSLWRHVTFRQTFVDPIVVATPLSLNAPTPATVRIRNIGPTGFDIRIQPWDYLSDTRGPETVSYLAMERGPHTLGTGIRVEAGRLATNLGPANKYTAVTFTQSFVAVPAVVTSVTSVNETDAVITQETGITSTSFQVRLQEQCGNAQRHTTETIDYIAWAPSAGTVDGFTFEVHTMPAAVTNQVYTIRFQEYFLTIPMFLAAMQTNNGSYPATLRWANESPLAVDIEVQEEASCSHKLTSPAEVVGYMAFTYP